MQAWIDLGDNLGGKSGALAGSIQDFNLEQVCIAFETVLFHRLPRPSMNARVEGGVRISTP